VLDVADPLDLNAQLDISDLQASGTALSFDQQTQWVSTLSPTVIDILIPNCMANMVYGVQKVILC
jgi:hypothetical protein